MVTPEALDFRVMNTYELPKQLLSMFLDQELSLKTAGYGVKEALTGEPLLTPLERTRLSEKVRVAFNLDKNPALDAFLEVATNPLSYLAFLPVLGAGAKLALGRPSYSAWANKSGTVLQALGLESGAQAFRGTSVPAVLDDAVRSMERFAGESERILGPAYTKMVKRARELGAKDLTGKSAMVDSKTQQVRREIDGLLHVYLEGLNKDVTVKNFRGISYDTRTKRLEIKANTGTRKALVDMTDEQLEAALQRYDALDFAKAVRADQKRIMGEVFGTTPEARNRNASRMFYSMRGVANAESHQHTAVAKASLQSLFGARTEEALSRGYMTFKQKGGKRLKVDITEQDWQRLVNEAVETQLSDPRFVSRNVFTSRDEFGGILPTNLSRSPLYDTGLIPTGRAAPRTRTNVVFGEDDLDVLASIQGRYGNGPGPTREWHRQLKETRDYHIVKDKGVGNIRRRLNVIDSHSRYVQQMNGTKALFIDELSPEAAALEKAVLDQFKEETLKKGGRLPRGHMRQIGLRGQEADDILTPYADLVASRKGPVGGYTRADLLDRAYRLIPETNQVARSMFKEALLPRMLGEMSEQHFAASVMMTKAQDMVRWFTGTEAHKWFKSAAPGMGKKLDELANAELPSYAGSSIQHKISEHLYGTHLGLNFKSVIFNLTQPLITMPAFASLDEIASGYGAAIKRLTGYYDEAFRTPGAFTNRDVMYKLRRKHFDLVGDDTGDLLGLTEDLLGQLDIGNTSAKAILDPGRMSIVQRVMIPFQQGEITNRVVTSEIIRKRLAKQGLDPHSKDVAKRALARAEIKQVVEETQFGASLMNTLGASYGQGSLGKVMSQPIIRQFMTFPLRMMTLPIATLPRMTEAGWIGAAGQAARTVGYSAIAYELLRSDLIPGIGGADMSDFLVVSGATQLVSGAVDGRDGPLPIPPAISIGYNLARGFIAGDNEMIANEFFRTVPGGIALGRVIKNVDPMGIFRPTPHGNTLMYPYNRVDYGAADEEGRVPIYDPQGRLLERQRPLDLVLRGAGLDMSQFQTTAELDNFLVKQRDQMVQYEQRIVQATLNGDHGRAQQLAAEFQERFGFAPKIERSQFQTALRNREMSRTERILSRMDPQVRDLYTQMAAERQGQDPRAAPDPAQLRGEAGVAKAALDDMMMRLGP